MDGGLGPHFPMQTNWRDSLNSEISYKRKFAFVPTNLINGERIWFKFYYRKYISYYSGYGSTVKLLDEEGHTDVVENVSAETFVIRRLSENL